MEVRLMLFTPSLKGVSSVRYDFISASNAPLEDRRGLDVKTLLNYLYMIYGEDAPITGGSASISVQDGDEEAIYTLHYQVLWLVLRQNLDLTLKCIDDLDNLFSNEKYAIAKASAANYEGGLRRALR